MGLILEIEKPLLLPSVHINGDDYRAGIDLLGFLLVIKEALLLQYLRGYGGDIHEADILPVTILVERVMRVFIFIKGSLYRLFVITLGNLYICKLC